MLDLEPILSRIEALLRTPGERTRALLVALSGIDGSGKGFVAEALAARLEDLGHHTVAIGADAFLHLPHVRHSATASGAHFYRHAFRFEALFGELVRPLRERRRVRVEAAVVTETATAYVHRVYAFEDVDVILLEGCFLLKRELRAEYDLAIWVDCSFETALERAIARGQEGLGREATIEAFRTIYVPAQELHRAIDAPREAAHLVVRNDPRLG